MLWLHWSDSVWVVSLLCFGSPFLYKLSFHQLKDWTLKNIVVGFSKVFLVHKFNVTTSLSHKPFTISMTFTFFRELFSTWHHSEKCNSPTDCVYKMGKQNVPLNCHYLESKKTFILPKLSLLSFLNGVVRKSHRIDQKCLHQAQIHPFCTFWKFIVYILCHISHRVSCAAK